MAKVKTEPVSLNEWSLEMNIAHEIANMFDSPFGFMYPFHVRRNFDIMPVDVRKFFARKSKIYKLSPAEEGSGGGWDTKISIPKGLSSDSRAIFIQFKSGRQNNGNDIPGSKFNIAIQNPNPHIEFTFNDNGNPSKNKAPSQHQDLRNLANYLKGQGFSEKCVMYGFPRIASLTQFEKLNSPLLLYTTFLTINDIDNEAEEFNADLYDGELHYFRTHEIEINTREISTVPFQLKRLEDSHNVISEIMLVKLCYIWNYFSDKIPHQYLKDEIAMLIAEYLQINPVKYIDKVFDKYLYKNDVEFYFENIYQSRIKNEKEVFGSYNDHSEKEENRIKIFKKVNGFFNDYNRGEIDINTEVNSKYSSIIGNNENIEYSSDGSIDAICVIF